MKTKHTFDTNDDDFSADELIDESLCDDDDMKIHFWS